MPRRQERDALRYLMRYPDLQRELAVEVASGRGLRSSFKKLGRKIRKTAKKGARIISKSPVAALVHDIYRENLAPVIRSAATTALGEDNAQRLEAVAKDAGNALLKGNDVAKAASAAAARVATRKDLNTALSKIAGEQFAGKAGKYLTPELQSMAAAMKKGGYADDQIRAYFRSIGALK